jgi:hypothetical protein
VVRRIEFFVRYRLLCEEEHRIANIELSSYPKLVNILVVIGNEKLHLEISKLMSINKTVQVVRVPKNGGVRNSLPRTRF